MSVFTSTELEVFDKNRTLAYPSANAINGGEINSEENIRNIVTRLSAKSYVIKRVVSKETNEYAASSTFQLTKDNNVASKLIINGGEANIRGYYFRSRIPTEINLNSYLTDADSDLYKLYNNVDGAWPGASELTYPTITMYVYLNVKQDSAKHILTYDVTDTSEDYTPFRGVVVDFTTTTNTDNDLLLGSFELNRDNSGFIINNVISDENRFTFLDANDIYVYNETTHQFNNLKEIVQQYVQELNLNDIYDNLIVYGPTISDNGTCIYLTNNDKNRLFKLYFDQNSATGGLGLYESIIEDDEIVDDTLIQSLLSFTSLPVSGIVGNTALVVGTITEIAKSLTVDENLTVNGNTNIDGNTTLGSASNNTTTINGSITVAKSNPSDTSTVTTIDEDKIIAKKVFGAVWG